MLFCVVGLSVIFAVVDEASCVDAVFDLAVVFVGHLVRL